jgi:hypothetical protein
MMKHLLEYEQHQSSDHLKWGEQIKRWVTVELASKSSLKDGYELKSVEVVNPVSSKYSTLVGGDSGKGEIELYFKKVNPSELDDLVSDLSDVGLSEDKKIEIEYEIQANPHNEDDEYFVLIRLTPKKIPNFMGMKSSVFRDNDYDMSFGVGKTVAEEIRKQIS